jgi:type I restriction-modification system DNA methylase subunit
MRPPAMKIPEIVLFQDSRPRRGVSWPEAGESMWPEADVVNREPRQTRERGLTLINFPRKITAMASNFDEAFAAVQSLAKDFDAQKDFYLSPKYQEAEARRDFIDKFLIALGWDVNHDKQKNPYEQEVKVERKEHGVSQRRADYAFYLAPNFRDVKFYIEAKKPFGDIATPDNYFQTIRYGWGSKTKIAALFDFEQFEIVDCRFKPDLKTALQRNLKKFKYTEYADKEKFAEIYWLFSREAVASGSLEKYAETLPKSRGTVQRGDIDDSFLEDLDAYRDTLAHIFKNSNPKLDGEALTEATQRTLDRLVFIRFLEDKLIEPQHLVARFGERGSAWGDFIAASRRLDGIYNGIVFKKNDILDSPTFKVDDEQFSGICKKLSHVNSIYDFNAIPIHILGSIYERFLGKVIVATDKRARVEEKPEVRKAGGVYYTPEYIVRYIVENTVGKLIEGKTPAQIAEMRFADIACGSGSFLLGVYDLLIRYHTKFYNENPAKAKKGDVMKREDGLHLSLQKKREILVNNLYGVDIDNQAVEVAQLSLYLKLLQDETPGSTRQYILDFEQQALLPTLNKNIVCGNSLVGTDILSGELFEPVAERKLNPMDFEDRFPQIFRRRTSGGELRDAAPGELDYTMPGVPLHGSFSYKKSKKDKTATALTLPESEYEGGFDAIVGNPPYVRIQGFPRLQLDYFSSHYQSACGNFDLYVNFIERGYKLLKTGGLFGQIVPNKFFKTDYGEGLRKFIIANTALQKVVNFGASQVFNATTYTCLLFLEKKKHPKFCYALSDANPKSLCDSHFNEYSFEVLTPKSWIFGDQGTNSILDKITQGSIRLLDLPVEISRGSSTGDDEVFMVDTVGCNLEPAVLRVPLFASDFSRYCFQPADKWRVIFPYKVENGKSELMAEKEFQKLYPMAFEFLQSRKSVLLKRKQFSKWFGYSAPRNLAVHERAQICIPLLADRGLFALIPVNTRGKLCPMASGGFTIAIADSVKLKPEYILGLLNSSLLFWRLRQISNVFRGGWITCTKQYFGELPIRMIDFAKPADKSRHDKMVSLVEQMLAAKPQLARAQSDKDKNFYENKCATLDRQIDSLVYDLYGLTNDEIKTVEGATK